jgi:hypothetical protein
MATSSAGSVLLKDIAIAAPCKVSWESMAGDDKKRLCGACSKHVYDLSAMSEKEAAKLLETSGDLPCMRFFRRQDGTIIFENCPVGLRRVRDAIKTSIRLMSVVLSWCVSITCAWCKQDASAPAASRQAPMEQSLSNKPQGINLVWTLSENGPLARLIQWPVTDRRQLAQLGGGDRYSFDPVKKWDLHADWSGHEFFRQAIEYAENRRYDLAEIEFGKAIEAASKPESDPMYREFISLEYAKLLRKIGKPELAKTVEEKNKFRSSDVAVR